MSERYRVAESPSVMSSEHRDHKPSEKNEKDFEVEFAVKRLKRHQEVAGLIKDLESNEEIEIAEQKKIATMIENRSWNKLFYSLEKGDQVAAFIVPTGTYAIKHLNDVVLGAQLTDAVIEHQKMVLRNLMEGHGFEVEKQEYNTSTFKVNGVNRKALPEVLDMICQTVQAEMDLFIKRKVDALKRKRLEAGEATAELDQFLASASGYRLSFGTSSVKEQSYEGVTLSVLEALQSAKLSRLNESPRAYGSEFKANEVVKQVHRAAQIREAILVRGNVFHDASGNVHTLFRADAGTQTYELNRNIVRQLRKESLKGALPYDDRIARMLEEYRQCINVLDAVKPFTHEEMVAGDKEGPRPMREIYEEEMRIAQAFTSDKPLTKAMRQKAATILRRDQKDPECTSPAVFHREALRTPRCTYISIDALDVGVDVLLSYEQAFQTIEKASPKDKPDRLREAMLEVGDKATVAMRTMRTRVREYCREKLHIQEVPLLVGGDELTLALPTELVDEQLLLGLREATKSRVVASEVCRPPLNVNDGEHDLYKLHTVAMQEAEEGIRIAKKIEEALLLREQGLLSYPEDGMIKVGELFNVLKKGFVIRDGDGTFSLLTKEGELPIEDDHGRISVVKNGNRTLIYGAALVMLLALYLWR